MPSRRAGARRLRDLAPVLLVMISERVESRWREVAAVDAVVREAAAELDGEDPLVPGVRAMLDETTATLVELHKNLQPHTGEWELPPPDEENLEMARKIVERAAGW